MKQNTNSNTNLNQRWGYLVVGVIAMLFAGVLYAWSILKTPLTNEFGWSASQLALNFTIAMSFFCIGGLLGAQISKRVGHKIALITAGVLSASGFILTALLQNSSVIMLYISYGVLAGMGIGIAYNVLIGTVSAWFPDKKGLCSGCLMMGFGASALILGNIANAMFNSEIGWRTTYIVLGIGICGVLVLAAILLQKPGQEIVFPKQMAVKNAKAEAFEQKDFTSSQMLTRPSFWLAFICISFLIKIRNFTILTFFCFFSI